MSARVFVHPKLPLHVSFSAEAWAQLRRHAQWLPFMKERGGQLFAQVSSWEIAVTEVTGLRRNDRRSLVSFELDEIAAQAEISERFKRGLHFVGEWHTHPQAQATPSKIDEGAVADLVRLGAALGCVLLVIVGRETTWVGLRSKDGLLVLERDSGRRRRS